MKNHYISQFIIKRFSNAINVFNIKTGKIDENKRPHKVFYKNDIYDEELEKLMNYNIESKVSNIINEKILIPGKIIINREELQILKRYMLISSVRTLSEKAFSDKLRGFEKNANAYVAVHEEYSFLKSTKELQISDEELYLRTLKVYAKTVYIRDIVLDPLTTREMLAWAMPFIESYIAFWDAPKDKEYILTDSGMCSEYEGFHKLTGGLDLSKFSYLFKQIKNNKFQYIDYFASVFVMYENYSIFNISSKRSMIAINPFFKLYFNEKISFIKPKGFSCDTTLDKPDIWPAIIQDKKLFEIPECIYTNKLEFPPSYELEDKFIYEAKVLSNEDLVYINSLMLSQTNEIIGFNDASKIIESIYYFLWQNSNFNSIKCSNESFYDIFSNLFDNIAKSPFNELCKFCDNNGGVNKIDIAELFEKIIENIFKDFRENPYILEYLLENQEKTAKMEILDFLGSGYGKIETLKKMLFQIKKSRKNLE